jgi:hypothetical protein
MCQVCDESNACGDLLVDANAKVSYKKSLPLVDRIPLTAHLRCHPIQASNLTKRKMESSGVPATNRFPFQHREKATKRPKVKKKRKGNRRQTPRTSSYKFTRATITGLINSLASRLHCHPPPPSITVADEDASHQIPGLLKERRRSTGPMHRSQGPDRCHLGSSSEGIFLASRFVFGGSSGRVLCRLVNKDWLADEDGPEGKLGYGK